MKTEFKYIVPECYVDTNMVETLLQVTGVNHQYGCTQVTGAMATSKELKDSLAVGIIDADDRKPSYLNELELIASSSELTLYKHPQKHHYIVAINNIMESFILSCANELQLDLRKKGFPSTKTALGRFCKSSDKKHNAEMRRLIKLIAQSSEMQRLTRVLTYIHENKYKSTVEDLIELMK